MPEVTPELIELYSMTTPSGQEVFLTQDEEREIVKDAIRDELYLKLTRGLEIQKASISALGTAAGMTIGGLLVGWLVGRKL
jgi:hypothetical protein